MAEASPIVRRRPLFRFRFKSETHLFDLMCSRIPLHCIQATG